jgi:hypothetical protein
VSPADQNNRDGRFASSPTGPRVRPPQALSGPPRARLPAVHRAVNTRRLGSVAVFVLLIASVGIRAYKDLSQPEAWAYWKDQYVSPSLTASLIGRADFDGSGHGKPALAIRGTIGPAAASWLRKRIDEAHLAAGGTVLLSSPGGDLSQAAIMGELIRSHGLATAVGTADDEGRIRPAYCASACVLVYAGGKPRYGLKGSRLGVHRFFTTHPVDDAVADTQRTSGLVLGYFTKMGVSSAVVEAMSQTGEVRWLDPKEALAMNLITDPVDRPVATSR